MSVKRCEQSLEASLTKHRAVSTVAKSTFAAKMPMLMIQVLKDSWTRNPEDAQKTFDLLGSKDKELFWIEKPPSASRMVTTISGNILKRSLLSSTSTCSERTELKINCAAALAHALIEILRFRVTVNRFEQ